MTTSQRVAPSASAASIWPARRLDEHLARDRGDDRQDHHRQHDAGGEDRAAAGHRRVAGLEQEEPAQVLVEPHRERLEHCSIESREQAFTVAEKVVHAGARFFRGGAYKPRTSPYAFQGLGEDGLKILAEIRERFGLLIVTEAVDNESLELVDEYADIIQIGARNMQNFSLLKRLGRCRKPVMLKRGMSARWKSS